MLFQLVSVYAYVEIAIHEGQQNNNNNVHNFCLGSTLVQRMFLACGIANHSIKRF